MKIDILTLFPDMFYGFLNDSIIKRASEKGLVDIEVHYPKEDANSYFKGYSDFVLSTTYDDPTLGVLTGNGKEPKTGTIIYAQGTSSMGYPVKNLRAKFKGKGIKVKPNLPEVNLICFKADYMESSGTHNTGFASFVSTLYDKPTCQSLSPSAFHQSYALSARL